MKNRRLHRGGENERRAGREGWRGEEGGEGVVGIRGGSSLNGSPVVCRFAPVKLKSAEGSNWKN